MIQQDLKVNGGHIDISRTWALSLLEQMTFKKRKRTTAKSKYSAEDFIERKKEFLDEVATTAQYKDIPPELILNWDQTGIHIVPRLWRHLGQSEMR